MKFNEIIIKYLYQYNDKKYILANYERANFGKIINSEILIKRKSYIEKDRGEGYCGRTQRNFLSINFAHV